MSQFTKIRRNLVSSFVVAFLVLAPVSDSVEAATTTDFKPQTQQEMIAYLQGVLAQLQAQVSARQNGTVVDTPSRNSTTVRPNPYFVSVRAEAPGQILRDQAILQGVVYTGSAKTIEAWFEYGVGSDLKSRSELFSTGNTESSSNRSSGTRTRDNATVNRTRGTSSSVGEVAPVTTTSSSRDTSTSARTRPAAANRGRSGSTSRELEVALPIDTLKSNTKYTYRLVAEDDKGYRHYSQTRTFTTIAPARTESFSGVPGVDTEGVTEISSNGATIEGFVTLNDYNEGQVFFMYGTDRTRVNDIEDYETYDDVSVSSDSLVKIMTEADFYGRDTVTQKISSLKAASTYYYRVCLAYDDKKKGDILSCGDVESFSTAN